MPRSPVPSRRRLLRAGLGGLVAGLAGGCAAPRPPVRIGSLVFPGYELLFLARESGRLDPARVRLVELLSNTDTLRALAVGQLEGAQLTLDEVLVARARGLDLRIVHVLDVSDGADAVVARPTLAARGLAALRGRRIAVEDSAGGIVLYAALLRAAGLSPRDVVKVPMTLDRSVAVYQRGEADVIISAEPWLSQLEHQGAQRLLDSRAVPGQILDVLAVRADALADAAAWQHAVDAHAQALQLWRFDSAPDGVAARLMAPRLQVPPADVPALFRGLHLPTREQVRAMLAPEGTVTLAARQLLTLLAAAGVVTEPWAWARVVEPRFVQAPFGGAG